MSKTRMGKRVASLLLSLVMMLSLLPTTVYAEGADTGDTTDAVVEETIAPVNAEGVDAVDSQEAESNGDEASGEDGTVKKDETSTAVAKIGDKEYETLDAAIEAVQDGEIIEVNAVEYKLPGSQTLYAGKAFTIKAADGATVSFDMSAAVALHGAKITFNNVTFNYKTNGNYIGLQHADTLVYNNCTINGMVFLYAVNETFNNCTFNQTSPDAYNVWTYGAQNVAFNGCIFNCAGKAVLVYNEGAIAKTDLTVTKTSFNASASVTGKAAIEIDTSLMEGGAAITVDEQTKATGFANGSNSGSALWNDKKQTTDTNKNTMVTVAGEKVFEPVATAAAAAQIGETTYETLAEAFAAGKDGDTITLLRDCSGDGIGVKPGTFTSKGLTVDFAGHAYTVGGKLVGSSGTMSNGFQLNKNNKITFQNGAIYGDASVAGDDTTSWSGAPAILIQNYCDLTLSGMKVSGGSNTVYTMSNNCGNVVIENTTINAGRGSSNRAPFALDACGYSDYTGVSVTVKGTSAINGDIEVSRSAKNKNAVTLTLESGTVNGKLKIDSSIKSGDATTVTKSNAVNVAAPAGYVWDNGTLAAAVAQIGETGYASLQAAIDAVKSGGTIKLLQNVDLGTDNYLSADSTAKNVTIDLGNHAVTSAYKNFTLYLKVTNWTIQNGTIKNTNTGAYGTLAVTTRSSSATLKGLTVESATNGVYVKIASGFDNIVASITVEDGTKISGDQYGVYMEGQPKPYNKIRNGQEILNVNGGEITGKTAAIAVFGAGAGNTKAGVTVNINGGKVYSEGFAIAGGGATLRENTTINISGGEVISTKDTAIYHPQAGTVTISGGEVYGVTGGVQMCAGTLNVTGGTISATGNGDVSGKTGDGSIPDGAAVSIVNRAYPAGAPTMTISGGTFTSAAGVGAVQAYGWKNNSQQTWDKPNASVSGGTFTSAVPENYCANGYIPVANDGGTYTVKQVVYVAETNNVKYESLQAAIDAASRKATVKLLADTRENVTIANDLTLDLNGHTLNGGTEKGKPALTVKASVNVMTRVTVKDSSEAQTGIIMREDTAENSGVSSHYVIDIQGKCLLTFESGNVKNNSGNKEGKGASLVRVGDDSNMEVTPFLTITGGTFTQNNFIAIKVDRGILNLSGGEVNSANSYAVENWCNANIKGGIVNGTVSTWVYSKGAATSKLTIIGGTVKGDVASVNYDSAADKQARVFIEGGTVTGTLGTYTYNNGLVATNETSKATIKVSGGTFNNAVETRYCDEGYTPVQISDGKYGVQQQQVLATVGNTSYYTMEEAFKAQTDSREPIVMLRDYTTGSPFWSGSIDRTVDLNGHTWTCTGTDANSAAFEINYPNASLTVKNGKIVSSQLVGLIPSASGGTHTYDNSSLTFENVKMSTTATSGIETNGNNTNDSVKLVNSTLNVPNGFGIYFPSSGTLTIDNSKINAKTMGVQVCAGSLSISGDQTAITVSGDAVPKTENDGAIQDGAAISIVNRPGYKGLGDVTVTGGTFKANGTNEAIKAYNWANNTESAFTANDKINVSGGTFSSAVKEEYCATGYIPTTNSDGTHGVKEGVYVAQVGSTKYESLAAAIGAAQDSDTVTLLKDIDLPATAVVKGKTITLDLNGKTISNSTDIWNESKYAWSLISVRDNGDLTINDTTGGGTLKAKENDCFALDVYAYDTKNVEDTKLTINAGNYVGNISAVYAFTGKATINGGHFSIQQKESGSDPYRLTLNCYDSSYTAGRAGFTVNGGTFENFDPRNNPAEGAGTSFVAEGVGVNNENGNFTAVPNMAAQRIAADGSSVEAYATLADAIAAAQDGQTVMLLADVNGNVEIAAGKNLTLDLNGFTLNGGTGTAKAALTNYGTITIKDSSADKAGTIKRDDNGTVGETSYYVIDNQGTMTIESGTVSNNSGYRKTNPSGSMVGSSLIRNGDDSAGTLTITGGTFTQDNFIAIKNGSLGTLHVTGGTITSKHSAIQNWFNADITGGEIKGQLWTDAYIAGESVGETKIGGDATFTGEIVMDITGSVVPTLAINGGDLDVTNWRITPAAAKAGAKPAISGGTFSSKVPAEYCAPGYVPTGEGADGRFTVAEGEFTVQVTSRTVSSESPVAHVSGGGSGIKYATGTTATTTTVAGYEFVGWYVDNYPDGKCLGKELTISYKPTANCTLVAVYEPISGGTFELKVDASKFQVNGGATNTSKFSAKLAANSLVTINFTGDNFLYWVNGSGKVVSTSKEYKFTLVSATVLSAVYTNSEADEAQVIFLTANPDDPNSAPQIVSSKAYAKGTTTISFPAPPVRIGKRFTGWSMTEEQIIAAIPGANVERGGKILVYAMYEDQKLPCTVTVFYGDRQQKIPATIGTRVELTAPQQVDGKEFSYWKDSEGKVLGTTSKLYVTPVGNMTVYAVYGETVEQLPTISMLKPVASVANEKYVVTFSAVRSIPDGYTIEELGILYSMDRSYGNSDAKEYMVLGSDGEVPAGVYRARATQTTPLGTVRCNITTGSADRTFYARGYMILKDSEGNIAPYYSEIASGSYNSLTNGGN